jgi:hypothetical protein
MAVAGSIRTHNAEQLRRAMKEHGYSLREMAIEVENVRKLRVGDDLPTLPSLRRTISQNSSPASSRGRSLRTNRVLVHAERSPRACRSRQPLADV